MESPAGRATLLAKRSTIHPLSSLASDVRLAPVVPPCLQGHDRADLLRPGMPRCERFRPEHVVLFSLVEEEDDGVVRSRVRLQRACNFQRRHDTHSRRRSLPGRQASSRSTPRAAPFCPGAGPRCAPPRSCRRAQAPWRQPAAAPARLSGQRRVSVRAGVRCRPALADLAAALLVHRAGLAGEAALPAVLGADGPVVLPVCAGSRERQHEHGHREADRLGGADSYRGPGGEKDHLHPSSSELGLPAVPELAGAFSSIFERVCRQYSSRAGSTASSCPPDPVSPLRCGLVSVMQTSEPRPRHSSAVWNLACCRATAGSSRRRWRSLSTTTWSSNSRRTLPMQRSATPFCQGLRYAILVGRRPAVVRTTRARLRSKWAFEQQVRQMP